MSHNSRYKERPSVIFDDPSTQRLMDKLRKVRPDLHDTINQRMSRLQPSIRPTENGTFVAFDDVEYDSLQSARDANANLAAETRRIAQLPKPPFWKILLRGIGKISQFSALEYRRW